MANAAGLVGRFFVCSAMPKYKCEKRMVIKLSPMESKTTTSAGTEVECMDWAIKAVKKRMNSRPGDSRSVIESLNRFNDAIIEGHDEVNGLLHETNDWLNAEMRRAGFHEGRLEPLQRGGTAEEAEEAVLATVREAAPLAAETRPESAVERGETSGLGPSAEGGGGGPGEKAGEGEAAAGEADAWEAGTVELLAATPKPSGPVLAKGELVSSPWSPYKVAKTLKESTNAAAPEAERTQEREQTTVQEVDSEKSINETKVSMSKSPENTFTFRTAAVIPPSRDRTLRRSNMFVPLPNKDPLVVQPMMTKTSLLKQSPVLAKAAVLAPAASAASTGEKLPAALERPSFQSQISKGRSASIFERLSSVPTKSFEKKIALRSPQYISRSPIRAPFHSRPPSPERLKAHNSGSPLRRGSTTEPSDRSDDHIQATLKSIFDTQVPELSNDQPAGRSSLAAKRKTSHASSIHLQRRSLIPRIDRAAIISSNNPSLDKRGRSMTPIKKAEVSLKAKKMNLNPSPHRVMKPRNQKALGTSQNASQQTPPKSEFRQQLHRTSVAHGSISETQMTPSAKTTKSTAKTPLTRTPGLFSAKLAPVKKTPVKMGTSVTSLVDDQLQQTALESPAGIRPTIHFVKPSESSPQNKDPSIHFKGARDRLTKFQLLPQAGSEKQDLKKKLDKRLSEVMRNQQEQQLLRRRQEQQKRKSQLEDGKKHRPRIFSEISDNTSAARQKTPANPYLSKLPNQSVLYDLHTADHRANAEPVPGLHLINGNYGGDTTLPDIGSDSENESGSHKVLAAWAQSPFLEEQLLRQGSWDVEQIFGPIPPLHIDEIFHSSRLSKLKSRQSLPRVSVGNNMELR